MTLNRYGRFSYKHQTDTSWDVSEWLLETRNQLTTWSDVYWHIWGTINYLECSRCLETFPCTEFSNCRYHPERAVFEPNHLSGEHPCCGLRVQRFDPLQPNKVLLPFLEQFIFLLLLPDLTLIKCTILPQHVEDHDTFVVIFVDLLTAEKHCTYEKCGISVALTYIVNKSRNFYTVP